MNYAKINPNDIANGPGVRVSLFVSGCTRHCPGCHNKEAWDFDYGEPFTGETMNCLMKSLEPDHIAGLTILGGEPLEVQNFRDIIQIVSTVREEYPQKTIWIYTGNRFGYATVLFHDGHTVEKELYHCKIGYVKQGDIIAMTYDEIMRNIDVLVDGEYIESERDISLKFRGSKNQRLIDMPKTLSSGRVVLVED